MKKVYFLLIICIVIGEVNAQCVLTTNSYTGAQVLSCITSCSCTSVNIADGATVDMDGDWDLTSAGDITLSILGSGSLVFSGSGGNRDELDLTDGSILIIEDTDNSNALVSGNNGNVFVTIGIEEFKGGDFDDIIAAGGADSGGVLPISLIYFNLQEQETFIGLGWSTASEENNDYFTLERSSNGLNFHELTRVDGAGNSFEVLNYSYQDKNPFQGVSYYRLKQTDYDGTNETFKVVAAEFYGKSQPITISQNRGSNELLVINNFDEENVAYIYDMMGRKEMVGVLKVGENYIALDRTKIQSGMYILKVVNALGNVLATQKFVTQ